MVEINTDLHGLLREDGDGCLLTFTNATEDMLAIVLAGWHIHLDHLANALVGHPVNWPIWTRDHLEHWKKLRNGYAEEVGEEHGSPSVGRSSLGPRSLERLADL